jgi:hypothetical protein
MLGRSASLRQSNSTYSPRYKSITPQAIDWLPAEPSSAWSTELIFRKSLSFFWGDPSSGGEYRKREFVRSLLCVCPPKHGRRSKPRFRLRPIKVLDGFPLGRLVRCLLHSFQNRWTRSGESWDAEIRTFSLSPDLPWFKQRMTATQANPDRRTVF